jgi:hypothetical protein
MHPTVPSKVWMSWRNIARILKLSHMTCRYALHKYQQQGFKFKDKRADNKMPGHRIKITDDIKKYLLNHARLQEWGGLTLAQRCQ